MPLGSSGQPGTDSDGLRDGRAGADVHYLITYKDHAERQQKVMDEQGLKRGDVHVFYTRGEKEPTRDIVAAIRGDANPTVCVVAVVRKYHEAISRACGEPPLRVVRSWDPASDELLEWLRSARSGADGGAVPKPSVVLAGAKGLVIAHGADKADELAEHRHAFVRDAVAALEEYAAGAKVDRGLARFFEERGLDLATTGKTRFEVTVSKNGQKKVHFTYDHLKKGDKTTRVAAARIYFLHIDQGEDEPRLVVILYCGPHPDDGTVKVDVKL